MTPVPFPLNNPLLSRPLKTRFQMWQFRSQLFPILLLYLTLLMQSHDRSVMGQVDDDNLPPNAILTRGHRELSNRTCFDCGVDHPDRPCDELRRLLKLTDKRKRPFYDHKEEEPRTGSISIQLKENVTQSLKNFQVRCPRGIEDCFFKRPMDIRNLNFHEKGCGSGPKGLDAEPREGCDEEYVKIPGQQESILFINCVCDNENLCNGVKGRWDGRGKTLLVPVAMLSLFWPLFILQY